jgi:hypothetical protein
MRFQMITVFALLCLVLVATWLVGCDSSTKQLDGGYLYKGHIEFDPEESPSATPKEEIDVKEEAVFEPFVPPLAEDDFFLEEGADDAFDSPIRT